MIYTILCVCVSVCVCSAYVRPPLLNRRRQNSLTFSIGARQQQVLISAEKMMLSDYEGRESILQPCRHHIVVFSYVWLNLLAEEKKKIRRTRNSKNEPKPLLILTLCYTFVFLPSLSLSLMSLFSLPAFPLAFFHFGLLHCLLQTHSDPSSTHCRYISIIFFLAIRVESIWF